MEHDAWFFVGVFAFIFLIWVATGGPTHPIAFTGPTLAQPGPLGGGTYLSLPQAPFGTGGKEVRLPGSSDGSSSSGNTSQLVVSFGTPSPYRGTIYVNHYVSGAGGNPQAEYLQFSLSQNASGPVTVSGWRLESAATGNAGTIPVGTEVPRSGVINGGLPVSLKPGEHVVIVSGRSPIGASFKENKCIGYFANFQSFSPSLPTTCPVPDDELKKYYAGDSIRDADCVDYVHSLSRCQVALTPPPGSSGACSSFLTDHLNYNGCVTTHEGDADFAGSTWHIYLGRSSSMWRTSHEAVKLLDENGKTVDAFSY